MPTRRRCLCAPSFPVPAARAHDLLAARRWIAVNEVRLLASLEHPNVVSYKQGFVECGGLYVIMEVVPNGDLSKVIE